jgi:hypothetical protein
MNIHTERWAIEYFCAGDSETILCEVKYRGFVLLSGVDRIKGAALQDTRLIAGEVSIHLI